MSAICGIVNFDGAPVGREALRAMAEAAAYRGPDGIRYWTCGNVGFAHLALNTTPESLREQQPLVSPRTGAVLVADARIDNRDDLVRLLSAKGYVAEHDATDADLILAAYDHWGDECPQRLVGDFAFAVWDPNVQRLLLARDVMAIRQLHYTRVRDGCRFGTAVGSTTAGLDPPPPLNVPLLEDFLTGGFNHWVCETAYRGVLRLPPAHTLAIDGHGASTSLYHVFGASQRPPCTSDGEWVEAFEGVLEEALRCRLRSTTPVALLTGGGVDSSSLACLADALVRRAEVAPPRLYAAVFADTPAADEREYFDAVAARCATLASRRIPCDTQWAFREFAADNGFHADEPDVSCLRSYTLAVLRAAAEDGCRVAVAGEAADCALGQPLYSTPEALRGVRLVDLPREVRYYYRYQGSSHAFLRKCLASLMPHAFRSALSASGLRGASQTPWVRSRRRRAVAAESVLARDFSRPGGITPAGGLALRALRASRTIARYGYIDAVASQVGMEWRFPFLDRRLLEFAFHIPHRLLNSGGVDRVILRESLKAVLPESIYQRTTKCNLGEMIPRGLAKERQRIEALLDHPRAETVEVLDARALRQRLEAFWQGGELDCSLLCPPILLEGWLRSVKAVPDSRL